MRRTSVVLLIILLIVLIGVGYFLTDPESAQEILVDLGLAEPVEEGYVVSGILEAQTTYLAGVNGGNVIELLVREGQHVEQGDTLVKLDSTLLEPLLDVAQARYEVSQAQLDMIIADPRDVDVALAQAAVDFALAVRDSAAQALDDVSEFALETIKDDQIALAQAAVDQAQAELDLAQANLKALQEGASESEIKAVEALVNAAEAELASQEARIDNQIIMAPFEGIILETYMLPGELALPGQPIVALSDLDTLEVSVYVPEADLGWTRVGKEVTLTVDAYPDRTYTGEIIYIADQAEFTPRNVQTPEERVILVYEIRIQVENTERELKPGLPTEVTFGEES